MMYDKKPRTDDEIAEWVLAGFERATGDRSNVESYWQEVAERTDPVGSSIFNANGQYQVPGQKRNDKILSSAPVIALNRFAAILDSLLTPANQVWHRLQVNNPELAKNRQVALWFEKTNRALYDYRYSPAANFSSQNQKDYKSLGRYGNAGMFIDDLKNAKGLRYKSVHLGQLFFDENHQGTVDCVYRLIIYTARQAKQMWPEEKLPACIRNCTDERKTFQFVHKVCPRTDDYDPVRMDAKGKPWASYYVSKDEKKLVQEGGYTSFPYAVSRYEQANDEKYGRGPLMEVLPSVKTLFEQKRVILKQGHKAVDPALLVADDGIMNAVNQKAGAVNFGGVSADGRPLVHAIPVGNITIGKELMDDEIKEINDSCLVSLFQLLIDGPAKTATEVIELAKEKGILIAPTMGRLQAERNGAMIERELDALSAQGVLDPMPPLLLEARGEYKVYYDSPLTRAARAEESAGFMRSLEIALQVVNATQDPSVLDFFDFDAALPEVMSQQGVPERFKRSAEAVAKLRDSREQDKQVQQMIDAGPSIAAVTKSAAEMKGAG